jgi:uncharacterized membrane protein
MAPRQTEKAVATLAGVTAVSAIGGSIYGLRGAPTAPREWLQGSPFDDYTGPSLILGIGVGGSSLAASVTAWRGQAAASWASVVAGIALSGWIAAQVAIIGPRSFLQPLFGGGGIAMIALGVKLRREHEADA